MTIERLDWDSQFFGIEIGRITNAGLPKALKEVEAYDLLYLWEETLIKENLNQTSDRICFLADCKRVYSKLINIVEPVTDYVVREYKSAPVPLESLYELAYLSGTYSRYKLDKHFAGGKFEEMYRTWVNNSVSGNLADYIYYVEMKGRILGFVTLKLTPHAGVVGLISVDKEAQGRRIGKTLMSKCEEVLLAHKIGRLEVSTQATNVAACSFYEKCAMKVIEEIYIYHNWKVKKG